MRYESAESIKENLILGIFSKENDSFNFAESTCIKKGDFSLRPLLINDSRDAENETSFYVVGKEIMDILAMNETEILELAKKNSMEKYPGEMKLITDFLSVTEQTIIPDGIAIPQVYVLTNSQNCCGAAALFYQPELLQNLADYNSKDLAVFPANLNCVYCVPMANVEQLKEYQEMYAKAVQGVEHILSENVLHYDLANKQLKQLDGAVIDLEQIQSVNRRRVHSAGGR